MKLSNIFSIVCLLATSLGWSEPYEVQQENVSIKCTLRPIPSKTRPHMPLDDGTIDAYNWSGYVSEYTLPSPQTGSVTAVDGQWVVPRVTGSGEDTYSSIWVGIDGFSNGTVEQIGTEHDWNGRSQSNYAWFEMYPSGAYEIVGFPVNVGDVISASVTYKGSGVFQLTLNNITRRVSYTIPSSYTKSSSAKRSSAEWIVEAPYYEGILPLSDFGTVTFTSCNAVINGITGAINNSHWQNDSINMVNHLGHLKTSTGALLDSGSEFVVTWVSTNN